MGNPVDNLDVLVMRLNSMGFCPPAGQGPTTFQRFAVWARREWSGTVEVTKRPGREWYDLSYERGAVYFTMELGDLTTRGALHQVAGALLLAGFGVGDEDPI